MNSCGENCAHCRISSPHGCHEESSLHATPSCGNLSADVLRQLSCRFRQSQLRGFSEGGCFRDWRVVTPVQVLASLWPEQR
jgi:hypothetical protein